MNILVVTQEINTESSTLGFFHEWLRALAPHYGRVEAVCLLEGTHTLPANVHVHSLGKEKQERSSFVYALRFLILVWKLRHSYDVVFVHMNEEYVLLAGWLWKFLGKRIYMWRNHYAGSWKTDCAAWWCTALFCTSHHSYTAKFSKTQFMPVGVDLKQFSQVRHVPKKPNSLLFIARIAPSKRLEMFIEALGTLANRGVRFTATIVGSAIAEDCTYYDERVKQVEQLQLSDVVSFVPGVPHEETPHLFGTHEYTINCSRSGMFDKTLFEAGAAGSLTLAISEDFKEQTDPMLAFTDALTLADRVETLIRASADVKERLKTKLFEVTEQNSLDSLARMLRSVVL